MSVTISVLTEQTGLNRYRLEVILVGMSHHQPSGPTAELVNSGTRSLARGSWAGSSAAAAPGQQPSAALLIPHISTLQRDLLLTGSQRNPTTLYVNLKCLIGLKQLFH